jgi:hypothetical protein
MKGRVVGDEDADVGATFQEEAKLLGQSVADGVAETGTGPEERNPHGDPSVDVMAAAALGGAMLAG